MKSIVCLLLVLVCNINYSQSECKPYVPMTTGTTWEVTSYSPKDKITGTISYELLSVMITDSSTLFSIRATSKDKKGEQSYVNEFTAVCKNGHFEFDMSVMIDGEAMAAYSGMEVDMDASEFEIPTMATEAGTALRDGSLVVKVGSGGVSIFKMTVLVTERKVEAKESQTTPAGTFDCLVISQKVNTKMILKIEATSKEWYAENIGVVRSESYNKKGKLTGYDVLTKLEMK